MEQECAPVKLFYPDQLGGSGYLRFPGKEDVYIHGRDGGFPEIQNGKVVINTRKKPRAPKEGDRICFIRDPDNPRQAACWCFEKNWKEVEEKLLQPTVQAS